MRVPLDGQNWAEIKPVTELTRLDRRAVNDAIVIEQGENNRKVMRASMDDDMAKAVMCHVVTDWSLPFAPPVADPDSVDRLSLEQDDKLREAIEPHLDAINGKNAPEKENEVPTAA